MKEERCATRFSGIEKILGGRKRSIGRVDGRAALKLVIAGNFRFFRKSWKPQKKKKNAQEKVKTPTARIACNVRTEAAVEPTPPLVGAYVFQGEPDASSDAALGSMRRHLKFDLEQIQRVHAEHCDGSRANSCKRMVLTKSEMKGPFLFFFVFCFLFHAQLHVLEKSLVENMDWGWTCATRTLL